MKAANEPAVAPVEVVEPTEEPAAEPTFDSATLFTSDKASNASALSTFTAQIQKDGVNAFTKTSFSAAFKLAITDKKSPATRESAANTLLALLQDSSVNKTFEVFF